LTNQTQEATFRVLIVSQRVVLPHMLTPIRLTDEASRHLVEWAIEHKTPLLIGNTPDLTNGSILTQIEIINHTANAKEATVLIRGIQRMVIESINVEEATFIVKATPALETSTKTTFQRDLVGLFRQEVVLNENIPENVADYISKASNASTLTDLITATLTLPTETQIELLNELNVKKRVERVIGLLKEDLNTLEAHNDVNNQVQNDLALSQREAYLREQLRIIQSELGEGDPFIQEMSQLHAQIVQSGMPSDIQARTLTELARLESMQPISPEAGIIRTYIQWLIDVPWGKASKDNLNIAHAEKVLKKAHYGLDKVKERILEHIAVRKLAGTKMKSPILCFLGPPGVGKTSLGKSIAEALGREFVRVSLGGVRDEAEIRGHRRTYVGALPGRIIQTLKQAGTINPVFMLDEIDKMSDDYRGDPSAALLEVLDPEQNQSFSDHYLEVPYDLSQVLFITTANDLDPLPEALEDRMEIIEFRAYTEEEKVQIAQKFLIPRAIQAHGLSRRGIIFQQDALELIVRQYTLEAGVRNLEREIANICRKLAYLVATKKPYAKRITPKQVEKFLGAPYVLESRVNREDSVGLVTGLVWSPSGGDTQIIEVSLMVGKGNLTLTGQLGDILQESAQAALSYMRSRAYDLGIDVEDFEDYDAHIHLPEGGVPKDGPSAGVALAIGIISSFTEQKVRSDFAMTGEITLRGYVLPVGGIKEKVLAARRRKIQNIILPADNQKDLTDIPKVALKDVKIHFVKHMQEIMDLVLLPAPAQRLRDIQAAERDAEDAEDES
jgi:ATP-dependent Lon protease